MTPGTDGVLATIELEPDAAVDALPDGIYARGSLLRSFHPCFSDAQGAAADDQLDALSLSGPLAGSVWHEVISLSAICLRLRHTDYFVGERSRQ